MLQIRRILFPTDYSECAGRAFTEAIYLAERFDAEIHILHVRVEAPPVNVGLASELVMPIDYPEFKPEPAPFPPVQYKVPPGLRVVMVDEQATSPEAGILNYEEARDPDLIVMGTHGRTGFDRLVMGSVAEDVLRRARTPVLTVHATDGSVFSPVFQRILVPVDFSEFTGLSLAYAVGLAKVYGAELVLLHVVEETLVPHVYGIEPVSLSYPTLEDRSREWMEELVRTVHFEAPSVAVQTQVIAGHPAHDIARFAAQNACDLIVISTHGRTGVRRLLLGSVTERVVRYSPVPVFTVRSFGKQLVNPLLPESLHAPA